MKEVILEEQFGGGNGETINKPNYKCLMVGNGTEKENKTVSKPIVKKQTKPKTPKPKAAPKPKPKKILSDLFDSIKKIKNKKSTKAKAKEAPKPKPKAKKEIKNIKGGKLSQKGKEALQLGVESLPLARLWWNVADGTYAKTAQNLLTRFRAWRNNRSLAQMDDTFDTDPEYANSTKPYMQDPIETTEGVDSGSIPWARDVPEENIPTGQVVDNSIDEVSDYNLLKAPPRMVAPAPAARPTTTTAAADDAAADVGEDVAADTAGDTVGDVLGDVAEDLLAFGKGKMSKDKKKALIKKIVMEQLKKSIMKAKGGNIWKDIFQPLSDAGNWIGDHIIDFVEQPYTLINSLIHKPQMRVQGQVVKPNLVAQRQSQAAQNTQQMLTAAGKKKKATKKTKKTNKKPTKKPNKKPTKKQNKKATKKTKKPTKKTNNKKTNKK